MSSKFTRLDPGKKLRSPLTPGSSAAGRRAPIPRIAERDNLPLSYAQERQWFLHQLAPHSAAYHVPYVLRLRGVLDAESLRLALERVIERHEILRTVFPAAGGAPTQHIMPPSPWELSLIDLTTIESSRREHELKRLVVAEGKRPFDLLTKVARTRLYRLTETEHVLQFTAHHIVGDAWSVQIILAELAVLYDAIRRGEPATLPELPIQYADYASWQRSVLAGETYERQLAYWKQQLAGAPDDTALPFKGRRPAAPTDVSDVRKLELSVALSAQVRQLARSAGATLFMTLLAATRALLVRYTGQDDICIATAIANRGRTELQKIVGLFINTLVLRTQCTPDMTFTGLLAGERRTALAAYDHQDMPFERIVDALQLPRSANRSPLFQVMFDHEAPDAAVVIPGLVAEPMELPVTSALDLHVVTSERGEKIGVEFHYNVDLFDSSTIEQMLRHWVRLVEGFVENPQRQLAQIPMFDDLERTSVLARWCAPDRDRGLDHLVHQLVEDSVDRHPDAIAVAGGGEQLSYRDLERRANQLTARLSSAGAGPDQLVAILLERSPDMVVALLAILKAGAAFLPLDVSHPRDRIQTIVETSGARFIVGHERWAPLVDNSSATSIWLDRDSATLASEPAGRRPVSVLGSHLAYVLFTSGSTGQPKGVMIEHRGLTNYLAYCKEAYPIDPGPGAPVHSAITFDLTVTSVLAPLVGGRTVHLVPEGTGVDNLVAALRSAGPMSFLKVTPTHLDMLAAAIVPTEAARLASCFIVGGEQLLERQLAFWRLHAPEVQIVNEYGPTETVVGCCVYRVASACDGPGAVAIGKPFAGNRLYVLDERLEPVAPGVPGELYIGGAQLARGYAKRPDLSAERFVPDPFGPPGTRMYRTGDLVRARPDDNLEFLGRLDHQVKIRGFRIELGEIESALASHPSVNACVVVVEQHPDRDQRLVAYVAPHDVDVAALRTHVANKLPEYMVPSVVMALDSLPLTASGKIDRKALPAVSDDAYERASYAAPSTAGEIAVAKIWRDVLGVADVGLHDNFFALGGNSLLVIRLILRIKAKLGVALAPIFVFENPTLAAQATHIDAAPQRDEESRTRIVRTPREGPQELSFAQQGLWFIAQLAPNSASYNIPTVLKLRGSLDIRRLTKALNTIVERHESLRTTFVSLDGQPRQVIAPSLEIDVPVRDVRGVEHARQLALAESELPFDLASGPLVRASILKLGSDEHWLLLSMHHIVSDGWSTGILTDELSRLYSGGELPPLAVQYPDFAIWQRKWLSGDVLRTQISYWKTQLSGIPELLELPTDRPRPPMSSYRGALYWFEIPPELARSLETLSRQEATTMFMTCLAAFKTLLMRYSRQEDVVVGSPVANRSRIEIQSLIGFFINTLVLRTDLSGNPTFRELLGRVREVALGAYKHEELPFEKLVEELRPARNLSYSPLFQVMFNLDTEAERVKLGALDVSHLTLDNHTSKFDLSLALEHHRDGMRGLIEYSTDLFDEPTIARTAGHFRSLLEAIVADPDLGIWNLPLLTERERHQILVEWNQTDTPYSKDLCIHELIEQQVDRTPDAIAVVLDRAQLTYRQLDDRANQLAHRLTGLGVGPEVLVGIYLERSLEMMVGLYAILKAGAAYVPLDPSYPRDRLTAMIEDAAVHVLLTQERLVASLPPSNAQLVRLDADWPQIAQESIERPPQTATPTNLAYVIFTSGSTGRPKGAMNEHAGIVNRLLWMQDAYRLDASDRVLQKTPFSFDVSVWELFWPLFVGATLVFAKPGGHQDPDYIVDIIRTQKITTLHFVPSMLAAFLEGRDVERCTSLRRVVTSGEALRPAHVERFFRRIEASLYNLYGPTEAAVDVTHWTGLPNAPVIPIGKPIANIQIYILDSARQPVPIGVAGELYIGGIGVGRGYLHHPGLTAERFVVNPFGEGRLYRTGDLVRWMPDGNIEFLGRLDHQVKIRGFRIELGEIESALASHPSVSASVVVVHEGADRDPRLVAYVAPDDVDVAALRIHVASKLPEYMVPSVVLTLTSLPLTPSGKIDRKALPAVTGDAYKRSPYAAPKNATEIALADVWGEVLGVATVGLHDNFFELGGHSLLATQVISRIRTKMEIEVPLRALFEAPTVEALSRVLDASDVGSAHAPIVPVPRDGDLPLSFSQHRLWFLDQLEPNSAAYNVSFALRLVGALDIGRLTRSLNTIVARHESLRTTFVAVDGQPHQVIAPSWEVDLRVREALGDEHARQLARAESELLFDLARGPLFRATLLRLGPAEHWLLLSMHHIVSDGWSSRILIDELSRLYEGGALPPLPVQYADFALWQRTWLSGDVLRDQLDYWKTQLADLPELLELPSDRPRPPVASYRGAAYSFELSAELTRSLEALSRQESTTLFMTCLAAFKTLLMRYSRQEDIAVGSPVANRSRADTQSIIGLFVNTVVLRTDLSGNPTFRELLARVREVVLGAYEHEELPFDKLVEELHPERNPSYSPLFQVLFTLENDVMGTRLGDLDMTALPHDNRSSKFDLSLFMFRTSDRFGGTVEYSTDLFDETTIEQMMGNLKTLLAAIVADPRARVSELPLLTDRERHLLLVEWSGTARADYQGDTCLHELFELQADRTPDAIAVVSNGVSLSYMELDVRANRLAHHLRANGAGRGELVGILLQRSENIVVAMLAALKSGAAYVPLDPMYPPDRIALIHEDARPKVLITESALTSLLPDVGAHLVEVDTHSAAIERAPSSRPPRTATRTDLSHVIFTSGSTGRPKGVAIEHGVMVNYCQFARGLHRPSELGAWLFATSVCFDMSLFEVFVPLSAGGRIHVVDDLFSLPSIHDAGLTFVNAVPSIMSAFLDTSSLPPSLEAVSCAGEPLPNGLVQQLHASGVKRVYDFYGPTETFIATWALRTGLGTTVIGKPIANTKTYVLDANLEPVPRGVHGDLYVAGEGLARCYFNRPDLTEERFVRNPFGPGRLYKTGDVVRWLPGGTLSYVGRSDHQVKIRGFRIEPGEIEAFIREYPGVRETVVIAREDTPGDKQLVAYVVSEDALDVSALRAHVKDRVPDYMVPSTFVALDAIPLTPNGKIDRKALPEPGWGGESGQDYVAPRTPTEELLAIIWAELLGYERIGVGDDFFELGGHSLLATQVMSRIRTSMNIEVPVRALFEAPTVEGLAQVLDANNAGPAHSPIVRASRDEELPLSFAQQRLWFLDQLEPNSAAYNHPLALRLVGKLDIERLTNSVSTIVARHESLRTTIVAVDGKARQVIAPSWEVDVPVREALGVEHARQLALAEFELPFDLARGPLFRATLLRLGPAEHWLLVSTHHIVSDGWSSRLIIDELACLYKGDALPPLPVQYADFALWQRKWLSGDVLRDQVEYWKTQLAGLPELLELPTDRPRPPVMSYRGSVYSFELSAKLTRSLEELSRQQSTTMFMTCLAAFKTLLMRYSRQEDVAVGALVANRNRAETEPVIGFFVNTVVLRTDLSGDPTFRELLARVREVALGAYKHEELPFDKLVEELRPTRDLSYSPLFQVLFDLDTEVEPAKLGDLDVSHLAFDIHTSKFDLSLGLGHHSNGMSGVVEYCTDLFDEATIARMAGHLRSLLEAIVANPDLRIWDLPLLTEQERHQILVEWNQTEAPYPKNLCIHELIEQQVDRTPDAIAVVLDRAQLTYRELDDRANQLAHHLIKLGARPETRVGICIGRSIDMMVALIGIFKAGAAYMPLSPDYPEDRLSFMLADSAVPILITEQRLASRLAPHCPRLVCMDTDRSQIADEPTSRPDGGATADNLAYVIYTSGSTGMPKGVQVEHRSVVNLLLGYGQREQLTPADRSLQFSSIAFDGSVNELFAPLVFGAVNVLRGEDVPTPAELLSDRYEGLTVFSSTTSYWHALVSAVEGGELKIPPALRLVNTGGERALPERVSAWYELAPRCAWQNAYGPAETTDISTVWSIRMGELVPGREVPIGKPLPNYTAYVLDARRNPVPVGVPGECYIGGDGVARGYLNRPELTEERFIANPFGPGRLYRTGDFVRWFPNGNLEFIGRGDHQVKIRGFRIELGEIEVALADHPNVQTVIVMAREIVPGDKRLVAYVVGKQNPVDTGDLRAFLSAKLPEYMIPWAFVVLDKMPVTPNGKVDLRALPEPDTSSGALRSYVAPRTPTEHAVAQLFEQLLGVRPVGAEDDFFLLGGHSLLSVQLCSMIQSRLGATMPLATMFITRTVETMARTIDERAAVVASNLVPLRREGSGVPLVMVHAIGGTVFSYLDLVARLAPGRPCYAIQANGVSEGESPAETIEDMARQYVELLDEKLEGRPCHLFGWSFGGIVVLEMARQLTRAGKRAASITLLDSFAPQAFPEDTDPVLVIGMFARDLGLADLEPQELAGMTREEAFAHVVECATKASLLPGNIGVAELSRFLRVFHANMIAEGRYKPETFAGDVTLIAAAEHPASDPSHGFRSLVNGTLSIRDIPGDHFSILRPPGVDQLRQTLDDLLSAAESRQR